MEYSMEFRLQPVHGVPPSGGTLHSHGFRLKAELHAVFHAELHAPAIDDELTLNDLCGD